MSWNLSTGQHLEILNPLSQTQYTNLETDCRSTLRLFPATAPQPRVSRQHCTLHGLRSGGATDHWLWYRDLPLLRRSGRWTSERTLERYIQEGTFPLDKKSSLQRSCRPSRCSRRARASFLCGPTTSPHSHHGATERVPGGVHSVLRSGVEQRSFAHTVSPLGALPLSLGDVGAKTKCKQTMHTILARRHWSGSSRLTRTAVAPWSCLSL